MTIAFYDILDHVAAEFKLTRKDLTGGRGTAEVAHARHICWWLVRELTDLSFPQMGRLANRDHTSIIAGVNRIELVLNEAFELRARVMRLHSELIEMDRRRAVATARAAVNMPAVLQTAQATLMHQHPALHLTGHELQEMARALIGMAKTRGYVLPPVTETTKGMSA